jgi:predicted nucleic acid-binding protein
MNIYAESSAVLSWLLGEEQGTLVRDVFTKSKTVITSELTLIECERVLVRATLLKLMTEAEAADRRAALYEAAGSWHLMSLNQSVSDRSKRAFPAEPVRTLDAIHLASALVARSALAGLAMLSLDNRVRDAAHELGLSILPALGHHSA